MHRSKQHLDSITSSAMESRRRAANIVALKHYRLRLGPRWIKNDKRLVAPNR